jgi:uncharacterized circularly permuted ATP-grasp superfamily protein
MPLEEWIRLEGGLKQRVRALNAFIHDIYHDQQILKAGVIPPESVLCNSQYRPEMQGVDVPGGIYAPVRNNFTQCSADANTVWTSTMWASL